MNRVTALRALCVVLGLASTVSGQIFSEATQQASNFNIQLTGESSTSGQCLVQNGPSTVASPLEFSVQNATTTILTFLAGANTLQLRSSSSQNSYLVISRDGQQSVNSIQYTAAGLSSGDITILMALRNATSDICTITARLIPQQSAALPILGLFQNQGSTFNLAPYAPAGLLPTRSCHLSGSWADNTSGPFSLFVPYGQTVVLNSTSATPLYLTTDATSGVITFPVNGTSAFQNATFTSYGNGLPTQLMLALSRPQMCTVSIYLIPFAGPALTVSAAPAANTSTTTAAAAPVPAVTATPSAAVTTPEAATPAPTVAITLPNLPNLPFYLPAAPAMAPAVSSFLAAFGRRLLTA